MRALTGIVLLCLSMAGHAQPQQREYIYGAELMSEQEREQYRRDAREAKDEPARTQLRERHRVRLRERARERGVRLREPHGVVEPAAGK